MNPNTATNEQLRDWLANHQPMLPIPNTIDAAAKCLPDGWKDYANGIERLAMHTVHVHIRAAVNRTPDEATDRFRLAVKAIQAMEDAE